MLKTVVKKGNYHDSVVLMLLTNHISTIEGVNKASIMMATPANKDIFKQSGLDTEELMKVLKRSKSDDVIIQDRTIYEDAMIFAPNLHNMGLMDSRDFDNYSSLFDLMKRMVNYPDLLIYLKSSIPNLVSQIQKRGREYENSIRIDYLKGLNEIYEKWIESYEGQLLVIDVDTYKFEERPEDFNFIVDQIDARLFGLFK